MSYNTLSLHCVNCGNTFRIVNIDPITTESIFNYCIHCGSKKIGVTQDTELGYWETLSQEYKMPVDALKDIYDLWQEDRSGTNFRQFVDQTKKMLKALGS